MNQKAIDAAGVLNLLLTQRELKGIMRERGVGLYGRLLKHEMAQFVAGADEDITANDTSRRRIYNAKRKTTTQSNELRTN